jgi:hypothetical protein
VGVVVFLFLILGDTHVRCFIFAMIRLFLGGLEFVGVVRFGFGNIYGSGFRFLWQRDNLRLLFFLHQIPETPFTPRIAVPGARASIPAGRFGPQQGILTMSFPAKTVEKPTP